MNINAWIVLGGVSLLLWLVPVEPVKISDVAGQIQFALEQFQTYEEARAFEDISFQRRVNIKPNIQKLETDLRISGVLKHSFQMDFSESKMI